MHPVTSVPYQRDLRDENKQVREHYISWEKEKKKKERCWKMKKENHVVVQARLQVGKKQ